MDGADSCSGVETAVFIDFCKGAPDAERGPEGDEPGELEEGVEYIVLSDEDCYQHVSRGGGGDVD